MTVSERIKDISKRSGLSEDIIRRVLNAECESTAESLAKGENVTLLGRCTFIPSVCPKLVRGTDVEAPKIVKSIGIKIKPSKSMLARLEDLSVESLEDPDDVVYEIPHLATMQIEGLV